MFGWTVSLTKSLWGCDFVEASTCSFCWNCCYTLWFCQTHRPAKHNNILRT